MAETRPELLNLLSLVVKQAILIVLLAQLGFLPSARALQVILGMTRSTIGRQLKYLEHIGLIRRMGGSAGYVLDKPLSDRNLQLMSIFVPNGAFLTQIGYKNGPNFPLITTTFNSTLINQDELKVVEVINRENSSKTRHNGAKTAPSGGKNEPPANCSPELWQALGEAHIGGQKRLSLAQRTDLGLTPELVRLWEQRLRKDKGDGYSTGLLIYVLESVDPAPACNELGHLEDCKCEECERLKYSRCSYCSKYPCVCKRSPDEIYKAHWGLGNPEEEGEEEEAEAQGADSDETDHTRGA